MRRIYFSHPDDEDVTALYIEALITRTPRRLSDVKTGLPAKGSDIVALQACERSMQRADQLGKSQHPAILHLYIHGLEMSNTPQRGTRGRRARADVPGLRAFEPYAGPHLHTVWRL